MTLSAQYEFTTKMRWIYHIFCLCGLTPTQGGTSPERQPLFPCPGPPPGLFFARPMPNAHQSCVSVANCSELHRGAVYATILLGPPRSEQSQPPALPGLFFMHQLSVSQKRRE